MSGVIEFDQVDFSYEVLPTLRAVTCSLEEGRFAGMIGPNGGGKTTFLKLVLGFLEPTHGTVRIFGKKPQEARGQVAYVPQNMRYDKCFPISVMELVLMGRLAHLSWFGRYSKKDEEAALLALTRVGILELKERSVGTLSGGQLQRALIARALASNPKLLLLDEPTANVDTQAESDIYQLLRQLAGTMTILMVTHDLTAAINLVDTILCVQGKVTSLKPIEVCEHFALGLYHTPLITKPGD